MTRPPPISARPIGDFARPRLVCGQVRGHIAHMSKLPTVPNPDLDRAIAELARAYRRANGPVIGLMQRFVGTLESQMNRLPPQVRAQMERAIVAVLTQAHSLAGHSERGPQLGRTVVMAAAMTTGAAGGAGGLASSLVELPITITVFLHAIRAEARSAGFDPGSDGIRAACLEVFSDASPLRQDDGMNTAFLSARLALTGPAVHKIIATVAPRLALVLGQKLAAQTVPILGAATGAAINAAYLSYYREIARIRFALMRLAQSHGGEAVAKAFESACTPKITKAR